jgi:hypothetical protein
MAEKQKALEKGAAALVAIEEVDKLLELHLTAQIQVCGDRNLLDL